MDNTKQNEVLPGVKNILAVASGKGGVGKSTIAANLAISLATENMRAGLLDADIFGPSIPKMFGIEGSRPQVARKEGKEMILPVEKSGIRILSIGFFIEPADPLVWRGPMATNALRQLIGQADWGELDYLIVDLPPGTSDIHLTLVQEIAVTGAIVVTTPQEVALADAVKGINMFRQERINIPVIGLVENMSWFTPAELPENRYYIFGRSGGARLAEKMHVPLVGQIPIVQSICEDGDAGRPTATDEGNPAGKAFRELAGRVIVQTEARNKNLPPSQAVKTRKK